MNPDPKALLAVALSLLLGLGAALVFDRMCLARGLQPPGFRILWRRMLAALALACLLALGVFGPVILLLLGERPEPDLSKISTPQPFGLHVLIGGDRAGWLSSLLILLEKERMHRKPDRVAHAERGRECRVDSIEVD